MSIVRKYIWLCLLFILSPIQLESKEEVFQFSLDVILVPYKADIEKYFEIAVQSITLVAGEDPNFYIEDEGVEYTFKSVINTHILKSYFHKFKAVSPKYGEKIKEIEFKIIDTIPPTIFPGENIVLTLGESKPNYKNHIEVFDNHTTKENLTIEVIDNSVDYKRIGTYEVLFIVKDQSGNKTYQTMEVKIIDNIKPTVEQTGLKTHQVGYSFYIEDYVTIFDNYDTNPIIKYDIIGTLENIGYVTIALTVTDSSNNQTKTSFQLQVVDKIPPELLLKTHFISLEIGKETIDPFSYIDYIGKNLTVDDIISENNINYNETGVYTVTFILKDGSGNETIKTLKVTIQDKTAPTIKASDIITKVNEAIDFESGIQVIDNYSKIENIKIHVFETNYMNKPGTYYVIYEVIDEAGNTAYYTRNIKVKGQTKEQSYFMYLIILVGVSFPLVAGVMVYKKRKKAF